MPVAFAIIILVAGIAQLVLAPIILRNRSALALPPNRGFSEKRWYMVGLIFYLTGPLAILIAVAIFIRILTGGRITVTY